MISNSSDLVISIRLLWYDLEKYVIYFFFVFYTFDDIMSMYGFLKLLNFFPKLFILPK